MVCTFVDDNFIYGDMGMVDWFRGQYLVRFKRTFKGGLPEDYLGAELELSKEEAAVYVNMRMGISKFLTGEGFTPGECRAPLIPAIPGPTLHASREREELYQNLKHYPHLVGTLMYYATRVSATQSGSCRDSCSTLR